MDVLSAPLHPPSQPQPQRKKTGFLDEDIKPKVTEAIDSVLRDAVYSHARVPEWNRNIVDAALKSLQALNLPYKYIVTCVIVQKTGAGLHSASSCIWDEANDGSLTTKWENKSVLCLATIFAVAI